MIVALLFLILFAILFPKALRFLFALLFIGGIMLLGAAHAQEEDSHNVGAIQCSDIIYNGWSHMPDVADYILAKPNSDKLGYGSECHLGSLVFAQCFLEPRWSVENAVDALIHKAIVHRKLPDTPVCGA